MKLIVLLSVLVTTYANNGCQVSIKYKKALDGSEPLILDNSYQLIHPDDKGILKLSSGEQFLLACPGKGNSFHKPLVTPDQILKATCVIGKLINVMKTSYELNSFICKKKLKSTIQTSGTCLGSHPKMQLGFKLPQNFVPTVEICRDPEGHEIYYTKIQMTKSINACQTIERPNTWDDHDLFETMNINDLYSQESQKKVFESLLKSKKLAQEFFENNNWLERGHLAAKADFVYGSEQISTFSFANVAPQWGSFNRGNWKTIETAVRKFAVDKDRQLTIYTGVYGQMTLKIKDKEEPLFLDIDTKIIKVPKFFWKVVHDSDRQLAIVFVGVNDPFGDKITDDMYLCPDISNRHKDAWFTNSLIKNDRMKVNKKGISYVCSYKEFNKTVTNVSDLQVTGILL